ncbi:MAG: DUF6286 domain-containing Asp23/Gls24 family envelope stress response protein [Actinomycetota bacterium]
MSGVANPAEGRQQLGMVVPQSVGNPELTISAGGRGELHIAEQAARSVVKAAVGEVQGVNYQGRGGCFALRDHLPGHHHTRVDAVIAGHQANVRVSLPMQWPYPAHEVANTVRDRIRQRMTTMLGVHVDNATVSVIPVLSPESQPLQGEIYDQESPSSHQGSTTALRRPAADGDNARTVVAFAAATAFLLSALIVVREVLVYHGTLDGRRWFLTAAEWFGVFTPQDWLIALGALAIGIGLWCCYLGLRPDPRKYLTVNARSVVVVRPTHLARMAASCAENVSGVVAVRSRGTRRRLTLTVRATSPDTAEAVRQAVRARLLDAVVNSPRLRVKTRLLPGVAR